MGTMFMNSGNSKTSDPHKLLLDLSHKTNLKRSGNLVALSNLSIYYTWRKYKKSHAKIINLKYQLPHGVKSLNYLMVHLRIKMVHILYILYSRLF